MNNKYKFFLINSICTILLAFGAISASAQVMRRKDASIRQIPAPSQETSVSQTIKNLSSVSGVIRWHKRYGMPPTGPATGDASPLPCGLIEVVAMKNIGGGQEEIATKFDQVKMTKFLKADEDGDYYVCPYELLGLPRDVNLTIVASFPSPDYQTIPWINSVAMPSDYIRLLRGSQSLTLTNAQPNAVVNFVIEYVPLMPR